MELDETKGNLFWHQFRSFHKSERETIEARLAKLESAYTPFDIQHEQDLQQWLQKEQSMKRMKDD